MCSTAMGVSIKVKHDPMLVNHVVQTLSSGKQRHVLQRLAARQR